MANYKQISQEALIEQNIWDKNEIASFNTNVGLYYYKDSGKRYYSIKPLNYDDRNLIKVPYNMATIFKYKTADVRFKHVIDVITTYEKGSGWLGNNFPEIQVTELNTRKNTYTGAVNDVLYGDTYKTHTCKTLLEAQKLIAKLEKQGIQTSRAFVHRS